MPIPLYVNPRSCIRVGLKPFFPSMIMGVDRISLRWSSEMSRYSLCLVSIVMQSRARTLDDEE